MMFCLSVAGDCEVICSACVKSYLKYEAESLKREIGRIKRGIPELPKMEARLAEIEGELAREKPQRVFP